MLCLTSSLVKCTSSAEFGHALPCAEHVSLVIFSANRHLLLCASMKMYKLQRDKLCTRSNICCLNYKTRSLNAKHPVDTQFRGKYTSALTLH